MPTENPFERRVRARLAELQANGLLRSLRTPSGIDLSSNDYLNLSKHPEIASRLIEGIAREGCGSTGSRLLRGERDCFEALERRFARFKGADRALFFGAGYLANIAVLSTLPERGDVIFSDERNHASLIDGMRLSRARTVIFPHNDVNRLTQLMDAERDTAPGSTDGDALGSETLVGSGFSRILYRTGIQFIVVESLFSMEGDLAPLSAYEALCRERNAVLIVDEAHATGIFGPRGSGALEAAGIDGEACVSINTAGKALGVAGAFVAGPSWAIEYLLQRARTFVFSTALPPALADAIDASLTIVADEPARRERVLARAAFLRARLAEAGVTVPSGSSQIVPIVIGDNARAVAAARLLQGQGFDIRAIRPPSVPPGTARLRASVNAALTEDTLDRFARALADALREVGLCPAASS